MKGGPRGGRPGREGRRAGAADGTDAHTLLGLLDLTSLNDDDDVDAVRSLCRDGATPWGPPAAVCVYPRFVAVARETLAALGLREVRVATVANFPRGEGDPAQVAEEIRKVRRMGADEVDVVFPWRALLAGDAESPRRLITAAREAAGRGVLKVILETGELAEAARIREAARIAAENGADFLKTSTGKVPVGATPEAVAALLGVIREHDGTIGLKVAGGVRTLQDARAYLGMVVAAMGSAWVTPDHLRFGASSLLREIVSRLATEDG